MFVCMCVYVCGSIHLHHRWQVLGLKSKQQQAAALHELSIMQHLDQSAAAAKRAPSSQGGATHPDRHQQHQHQQHQQQQQQQTAAVKTAPAVDAACIDNSSGGSTSSPDGSSSTKHAHLVTLLDARLVQQQQQDQKQQDQKQQQQQLRPADAVHAAASDPGSASAVVLVLPLLHQNLSWVLHFVHQR